jgi:hypothetical protein
MNYQEFIGVFINSTDKLFGMNCLRIHRLLYEFDLERAISMQLD